MRLFGDRWGIQKLVWIQVETSAQEGTTATIRADSERKIFNDDYFEAVDKKKDYLEKLHLKLTLIYALLVGILFINTIFDPETIKKTQFSLFGASVEHIDKLKELLLLIASGISYTCVILNLSIRSLKRVLRAHVNLLSDDLETRQHAYLKFTDALGSVAGRMISPRPHHHPTAPVRWWAICWVVVFFALLATFVLSLSAMNVFVWIDIWMSPSLPIPWSRGALVVSMVTAVLSLWTTFMVYIPLPHWDYTVSNALAEQRKTDPKAADEMVARLNQAAMEREQKSLWWRLTKRLR